ncbi:MAG: hypothetical protein ABIX01_22585 [Chitinophagaceae bacterium]
MANNNSQPIPRASAIVCGFSLVVLTSLKVLKYVEASQIDELAARLNDRLTRHLKLSVDCPSFIRVLKSCISESINLGSRYTTNFYTFMVIKIIDAFFIGNKAELTTRLSIDGSQSKKTCNGFWLLLKAKQEI